MRSLDLRDKKKLRCIWLAPDEGDQQIVRPPPLDSMQYAQINASMFGHNVMEKIKRADNLSVQLERSDRFMDAMHTYEQAAKMLHRCIQKREEAPGVMIDEIKWLRIDYEIRCVQLVALCMCGARKTAAGGDNTAFLLLKKAEELTARDGLQYCKKHIQRAAVYQNMANYYKKQKKYQAALQAAEKATKSMATLWVQNTTLTRNVFSKKQGRLVFDEELQCGYRNPGEVLSYGIEQ
ncbi:Tetratricopeptide repeat-containing domain [Phytophthora cinnamomi]|uniref:Tetratricopeptide repeat-containing domain n=1 Tax=Phytophthora cinnamomi TaxID=4785 RepID=UPI0035599998|nr:Tetratricopeptide repeat-containing domain [Phytophthora cinnamomi]